MPNEEFARLQTRLRTLTAIGDTPSEAQALYRELKQTLDGLAAKAVGTRAHPAALAQQQSVT